MANQVNYVCDYCNTTLSGFEKGKRIEKDYVYIQGKMAMSSFDKKTETRGVPIFLTSNPNEYVSWCDSNCMLKWMDAKHKEVTERLKSRPAFAATPGASTMSAGPTEQQKLAADRPLHQQTSQPRSSTPYHAPRRNVPRPAGRGFGGDEPSGFEKIQLH